MKYHLLLILSVALAAVPCVQASEPAVLYRVSTTSEAVFVNIVTNLFSWTNGVPGEAFEIQCSTGIDVPWQPVDSGLNMDGETTRTIRKPKSPIPVHASIAGMTPIEMGDSLNEGPTNELPVHSVNSRVVFIDRYEVSCSLFRDALQWAYDSGRITVTTSAVLNTHGDVRRLLPLNDPGAPILFTNGNFEIKPGFEDKPATHVTWYGALAYCNFRSEISGQPICINITNWTCNFNVAGFRLPTESEWEKAARGGIPGQRFPWAGESTNLWDDIDGSRANFWASGDDHETTNDLYLTPVGYYENNPNPINLFDLAGNVYEWCSDWYDADWYSNPLASANNTIGPTSGLARVVRGGAWCDTPDLLRTTHRSSSLPHAALPFIGFRTVRNF